MLGKLNTKSKSVNKNGKEFFEKLFAKLGYKNMEDWYNLTEEDIQRHGGTGFLTKYNPLSNSLQNVYPQHNWNLWKFKQLITHEEKRESRKKFFDWLGDK